MYGIDSMENIIPEIVHFDDGTSARFYTIQQLEYINHLKTIRSLMKKYKEDEQKYVEKTYVRDFNPVIMTNRITNN
jgi:hypothetical protein